MGGIGPLIPYLARWPPAAVNLGLRYVCMLGVGVDLDWIEGWMGSGAFSDTYVNAQQPDGRPLRGLSSDWGAAAGGTGGGQGKKSAYT